MSASRSSPSPPPPDISASASTHTYPPPPPPPPQRTLYAQSPHDQQDRLFRRRRARLSCGLDPLHVVALIVAVGLVTLSLWPQLFTPDYYFRRSASAAVPRHTSRRSRHNQKKDACVLPPHCDQPQGDQHPPLSRMVWQTTFTLPSSSKGCYLVTKDVERACAEGLRGVKAGIISLTIQHTSAALSLNENFDSTVRTDMTMAMDRIVPESLPWKHVDEGPDDSASHTKASLFGATITIPVTEGRFNLGTWQGIYLCEFRAAKHSRRVVATILS